MHSLEGSTLLVTGATGSFGSTLIGRVLAETTDVAVRAFSRDELKQGDLRERLGDDPRVRYLLGDVRDLERLRIALRGVDVVVHAAALKQVPACEYNPFEALLTNAVGTQNVITAAIEQDVELVVGLSSDKAVAPLNLYGATKLVAEKLLAQGGVYASGRTRFGAVRYGNVVGSRGSVVPVFERQAQEGLVTITDTRMTRFWITLRQAVEFVLSSLALVRDGETFVPKIPAARIVDLADVIAPGVERVVTGIRPGEKIHETLLTEDEARDAIDLGDRFAILPHRLEPIPPRGRLVPDGFRYSSDTAERLSRPELEEVLRARV